MNFNRLSSRFYTNIISWDGRRRAASLAALALAAAAVCASSINAQQRRGEPQQEQPAIQSSASEMGNAKILTAAEKDYRISAGDVIQIQIEDAPELSHNYRVSSSGHIEMPVLGMVEAQKRTTFELARQISKRITRRRIPEHAERPGHHQAVQQPDVLGPGFGSQSRSLSDRRATIAADDDRPGRRTDS